MSSRKIRYKKADGSIVTEKFTFNKNKKYKFNKSTGAIEELATGAVPAEDEITIPGSKSSLRRLAEVERNISILASKSGVVGSDNSDTDAVLLSGNQTIAGTKTFSSEINGSISGTAGDAEKLGGYFASRHSVSTSQTGATSGSGWITVAYSAGGRTHGEVIVSDSDSGDHAFVRIDWMRSYADSVFTVVNCGGHANRITGVRVLYDTADDTYGAKYLQVYSTATSVHRVQVIRQGYNLNGWVQHEAVTPVTENTKSGYAVHGSAVESLDVYSFASEEGIRAGGAILAAGDITAYSDIALKENVNPIADALSKVNSLTGITFTRKSDGSKATGVIAQEVEKVLPEAVHTDSAGIKAVAYGNLVGMLVESIKELSGKVAELESKLSNK